MPTQEQRARTFLRAWLLAWLALAGFSFPFADPEFRLWERLYDDEARRFLPSQSASMLEVGDLGYKTWVRALQAPRNAIFSTDRFGFRNPEHPDPPQIVVIGDSYVAGASLSDRETLTAQLGQILEEPVYNFATQYLNGPAMFLREKRFAKDLPRIVVWSPVARAIRPRPLFINDWDAPRERDGLGKRFAMAFERINRDNQLIRHFRFLMQGAIYHYRGHPWEVNLPDGGSALVLSLAEQGLLVSPERRRVGESAAMLQHLDGLFRRAGVRFVFAPVPESGTIYPEIFPEVDRRRIASPSFFELLLARSRAGGVEVVDLRPIFRENAWPYLYQRDDTHWNARAVALAAGALSERLRQAPDRPKPPILTHVGEDTLE